MTKLGGGGGVIVEEIPVRFTLFNLIFVVGDRIYRVFLLTGNPENHKYVKS